MGPRNLLILFFSTIAVSMVILIIFFSLFFKNINLEFDTRIPESAPQLKELYKEGSKPVSAREMEGIYRSTINVPSEFRPVAPKPEEAQPDDLLETAEGSAEVAPETAAPEAPHPEAPHSEAPPAAKPEPEEKKPEKKEPEKKEPEKKLEPLTNPAPANTGGSYQVYVDGFATREAAQAVADRMTNQGVAPFIKPVGNQFMVQVGVFSNRENAQSLAGKLGAKVRPAP